MLDINQVPFGAADILLPVGGHEAWSVIACDQHTSEPEYWAEAERLTGDAPSALHLILPELYLQEGSPDVRIRAVNAAMREYLQKGVFRLYENAMILVERTLSDGRVRHGLVGAVPLSAYTYEPGRKPLIRATEGTVLSRIPARVEIRREAPLELPHVMLLDDDPGCTVAEPLAAEKERFPLIYDFELMLGGGHLRGYLLDRKAQEHVVRALSVLCGEAEEPMLMAVGDGNHSLAAAKVCAAESGLPMAQTALVELVNIHDPALDFEPIYRVLFHVDPEDVIHAAKAFFCGSAADGRRIRMIVPGGTEFTVFGTDALVCREVQDFLDRYLAEHSGASVDYIHGEESVYRFSAEDNTVGFLFDGISKAELFPYVKQNGALPRKTFSMGEACDKRYYMEARKLR